MLTRMRAVRQWAPAGASIVIIALASTALLARARAAMTAQGSYRASWKQSTKGGPTAFDFRLDGVFDLRSNATKNAMQLLGPLRASRPHVNCTYLTRDNALYVRVPDDRLPNF